MLFFKSSKIDVWSRSVKFVNFPPFNLLYLLCRTYCCVCWPVRNERLWTCHAGNHGCSSSVDQSIAAAVLLLLNVLCVHLCLLTPPACVSPAVWQAPHLSQPAAADRLAEGEDQPLVGWHTSDPHGEAGTSSADRWALWHPKHLPQEPDLPKSSLTPQELAGAHHVVGEVSYIQMI